ncbi:uncharacterized protein DS421_5g150260 [Arachis hypogaea]|nr:uncharacterized protein DS421_5g150260 [Arachis hypogaea]
MTLPYGYRINTMHLTTIHNHASHSNRDTYSPHDMMIMLVSTTKLPFILLENDHIYWRKKAEYGIDGAKS